MELEYSKFRENNLISSNQICKKKDEISFQVFASNKGNNYLQEFHNLDQFHHHPVIEEEENLCSFDPFNPYNSYGCSSKNNNNNIIGVGDSYGGVGQVMDNFQSSGDYCYSSHFHHQRNSIIPLNFPEIKPVNFLVPDEISCISTSGGNGHFQKAMMNKNVAFTSFLRTSKGRNKPTLIKGQWTVEEDRLLVQLVEQYGVRKWSHIAQMLPGRIGKQCRERWHNHLRPDIKKDTWSEEEDRVLIEAHSEIGNKWAEIAKRLPGRTENSIKNHWNATKRRQYSKRKCRSKYPRCSLLQDYIKSLNLDSNTSRHQKKSSATATAISTTTAAVNNTKSKSADQTAEFCPTDWAVPNYEFKDEEEAEFYLDDSFFQEGCSINSLMVEDIAGAAVDDANNYDRKRYNNNDKYEEVPVEFRRHRSNNNVEMEELQYYALEGKFDGGDLTPANAAAGMEFAVKKELDLVEMMSQVNEVNKMK